VIRSEEWIAAAGYLVGSDPMGDQESELVAGTSWRHKGKTWTGRGMSLVMFTRPAGAARDTAPSTHPDFMLIRVTRDRYRDHIFEYFGASWTFASESPWRNGSRDVSWCSPRFYGLLAEQARDQAIAEEAMEADATYLPPSYSERASRPATTREPVFGSPAAREPLYGSAAAREPVFGSPAGREPVYGSPAVRQSGASGVPSEIRAGLLAGFIDGLTGGLFDL
jgi:hypothetical protein